MIIRTSSHYTPSASGNPHAKSLTETLMSEAEAIAAMVATRVASCLLRLTRAGEDSDDRADQDHEKDVEHGREKPRTPLDHDVRIAESGRGGVAVDPD